MMSSMEPRWTSAWMSAGMMVAMMLPSFAPALARHHWLMRAARVPRAAARTGSFAVGYVGVWAMIGVGLFLIDARLYPKEMPMSGTSMSGMPRTGPWSAVLVLIAGALQCSSWKARQLRRCTATCVPAPSAAPDVIHSWWNGYRFGGYCILSCAAPMSVLLVLGLMDPRAMVAITIAITAERIGSDGPRIARVTGVIALAAGLVMCARVVRVSGFHAVDTTSEHRPSDAARVRA